MDIADIYASPAGAVIEVDRPGEDDLLRLHRLGFHPTIVTSQSQTMVKQLSHGFALRGLGESDAEFQRACHDLIRSERWIACSPRR